MRKRETLKEMFRRQLTSLRVDAGWAAFYIQSQGGEWIKINEVPLEDTDARDRELDGLVRSYGVGRIIEVPFGGFPPVVLDLPAFEI